MAAYVRAAFTTNIKALCMNMNSEVPETFGNLPTY